MDETTEITEMDAMDNIEESENYTEESGGFPVIPTVIGGALVAGVTALVVNRKKLAAKIAEKRYEHALKVKEDYETKSFVYEDLESNQKETKK